MEIKTLKGVALASTAGICWGSMGVAAQYLMAQCQFTVLDLTSIRLLGAGLLLILLDFFWNRTKHIKGVFQKDKINRKDKHEQRRTTMKESIYKNYDELPLFLNAATVAKVLGIAPSSSYELMHEKDFPALRIGNRIVVPKEAFIRWVEQHTGGAE